MIKPSSYHPVHFWRTTIILAVFYFCTMQAHGQQCQYLDTLGIKNLQDSLVTNFPSICKKEIIGQSVLGRDIVALKISDNVNSTESEPKILLQGCIHGDEMNPEQYICKMARHFCRDYATSTQVQNMVDNNEIWLIATANPDGLVGHNYGHRPNANGIDLNRDFGYMWNNDNPSAMPFGEQETKLLRDFILRENFSLVIDYHSGLQGIIYPWYWRAAASPDDAEFSQLVNQYDAQSGYAAGTFAVSSGYNLYPTNGALCEFAYGSLGSTAVAVELTDWSLNACTVTNYNIPSVFYAITQIDNSLHGIVTDAGNGTPIRNARISVTGKMPVYSNAVNGDYYKYLLPGSYTVTVSANGYATQTFNGVNVTATGAVLNVQLNASADFAASKILICQNLDNENDPAETWKSLGMNDGLYYALGDSGYAVFDMGGMIQDVSGNDFTVHGSAGSNGDAVNVYCSASVDGPWALLGSMTATASFDLNANINVRYIKVADNGAGPSNVNGAGFHFDAITCTNITAGVEEERLVTAKVYPNPASDFINIEPGFEAEKILLYNASGQCVLNEKFSDRIDISALPAGMYFMQLMNDSVSVSARIVKQ